MNQNQFYSWLSQKKRKKKRKSKRKKNHTCFAIIWHFQIFLNQLNLIGDHSGFEEAAKKRLLTCFLEHVFWERRSEQRVKLANGHFLPSYLPHSSLDATASHSPEEQFYMNYSLAVCPLFSSTPHTLKHLIQHFLLKNEYLFLLLPIFTTLLHQYCQAKPQIPYYGYLTQVGFRSQISNTKVKNIYNSGK